MSSSDFSTWPSYFYPDTIQADGTGTLINRLNERDQDRLTWIEHRAAGERSRQLFAGEVQIPRTFDGEHLRSVHRHLFQDVYEWAGDYRAVNMTKGDDRRHFANPRNGELPRYLDDMYRIIATTDWAALDQRDFGTRTARVFAFLNQAHPFREGNGRTAKVFLAHLAEQSHFDLDFRRVLPGHWNTASQLSRPTEKTSYEPNPSPLVPVFQSLAVARDTPPRNDLGGINERLRAANRPNPYAQLDPTVRQHPKRPSMPTRDRSLER
ncbi:Fic/DOC family protein [Amnibacterium flavum]|uniref:Fic/DOC family protein n=1 Tax=Amnibacterium flavum TaxID=2173173 RepID=UPI001401DDFE|nr:Fic family protein [Amnibacterium flavum]